MSLELPTKRRDEAPNAVDHAVADGLADRPGIRHHPGVCGNAHDGVREYSGCDIGPHRICRLVS